MLDDYNNLINKNRFYKDSGVNFSMDNDNNLVLTFQDESVLSFNVGKITTIGEYCEFREYTDKIVMLKLKRMKLQKIKDTIDVYRAE